MTDLFSGRAAAVANKYASFCSAALLAAKIYVIWEHICECRTFVMFSQRMALSGLSLICFISNCLSPYSTHTHTHYKAYAKLKTLPAHFSTYCAVLSPVVVATHLYIWKINISTQFVRVEMYRNAYIILYYVGLAVSLLCAILCLFWSWICARITQTSRSYFYIALENIL